MIFGGRPCWKAAWQEAAFLTIDLLWWQAQLRLRSGNSSFLVAGPVGRRQGYNPNLGTRTELEGDWATTAILELGFLGGRPSWKMPASQCMSSCIARLSPEVRWSEMEWLVSLV